MFTKRQTHILNLIQSSPGLSISEIAQYLEQSDFESISKITLLRDLNFLINEGVVTRLKKARATKYIATNPNPLFYIFDVKNYFSTEDRQLKYSHFNFDVFNYLNNIFDERELNELESFHNKFLKNFEKFSENAVQKELERITVEFSWKSSQIEGNTYSILDTERLIKDKVQATGHPFEEAIMILNHKKAMDFIFQNRDYFREINILKIEDIHRLISTDLNINSGIRKTLVGIIGTDYKPIDNEYQIRESLEKLCNVINSTKFALEKALIAIAMISYIQPFEDGNKRTSRSIGNAILMANGFCPLSYKTIDEIEYKKAIILFYEQNSIKYFKDLFVAQFKHAVDKYF
ncbi:MAG: Fic family protein [Lachnospiraceae bacterium]|nr:Fic family protein [Lachnospiraceae bacterium]